MKAIKYFSLTVLALLLSFSFLDIQTSAISQPPVFLPQTGQSYTQEDLEGIWYTEDRYFFINGSGELTNIEPISMEVIHNFSGSFTVNNSYVTGSIYLDHTPSGGIRNDHDINYSGFFVGPNEIDMDWDVPGAGAGLQTWKRIEYSGNTNRALINSGNVLVLAQGFMKSRRPASYLTLYYLNGNLPNVDAEIEGSCGGNAQLNGSIDLQSGEFVGTLQYNNYCDAEDSGGFSVNGYANFTGRTDLVSKTPLYFLYDFVSLSFVLNDVSFSFTGRRGMNFTVFPQSSLFSYVKKDNCSGISYWVKDYFIRHSDGPGYRDIVSIIGRYYDPVYGYVEPSVEDTIRINDADEWASNGKMILTGAEGVQGGYTKIRIKYLSATEYLVEADTDGDGAYDDFNSGILLFAKLPRLRCFKGLPWLILLLD